MHRRYNFAHLILAGVVVLGLTPLMVDVDAQAQIAFSSERDGNFEIYVMDTDGKNQRRLTNNRRDDRSPLWSPDGKRIAFTSSSKAMNDVGMHPPPVVDGTPHIYVMDADGKNRRRLSNEFFAEWDPSWSPDGERIAFVSLRDGNRDIYVMDADGKNQRRLTRNPAYDLYPSWSPDGKRIVFVSERDGNYEIYVINADGARQVRRLTKDGSGDTDPAWFDPAFVPVFAVSPAGKKLTMWGWLKQVDR